MRVSFIIITFFFLACCNNRSVDSRLARIEDLTSKSPHEALDSFNNVEYRQLSDVDRHYYDFLSVKVADKAYIKHTSDSLILKVVEYESKHTKNGRYPEALYYAGRVYHDMGDLPTALSFYQRALDLIREEDVHNSLKGRVLSQIGGLINSLRLYKEAEPYVEEVISLNFEMNDSINLMYSLELLGTIKLHEKEYDSAGSLFERAKLLAKDVSPSDTAVNNMYLAAVRYYQGNFSNALHLIRSAVSGIDSISRNVALAYACDIYLKSNKPDTALQYAKELIHSKRMLNRKSGYKILLSDEMLKLLPADTILQYVYDYRNIMESYLNQNGDHSALLQNNLYNYQFQQREREKKEVENDRLWGSILIFIILTLILSLLILFLKNRNKSQLIQLHEAINNFEELRRTLNKSEHKIDDISTDTEKNAHVSKIQSENVSPSIDDLRNQLRDELLSMGAKQDELQIASAILGSEIYDKLRDYIKKKKLLPEASYIWRKLEEVVIVSSPDFENRLKLMSKENLKVNDYRTALLIKCGFSVTEMSILTGITKQAVVYRKNALGQKLFGRKSDPKAVDNVIRML